MSNELLKNEGEGEEVEGHKSTRMRSDSAPSEDADLGDEVEAHKSTRMRSDSAPSEDADLGDEVEAHKSTRMRNDDSDDFELHRHKT